MYGTLLAAHLLAAILWVGGMFFAYMVLRPALSVLEPSARPTLLKAVFGRFFIWVGGAIAVILATGYAMLFGYLGGFAGSGAHVHIMHLLGLIMTGLFIWIVHGPFMKLRKSLDQGDPALTATYIGKIRHLVAVNLVLGVIVSVIAVGGRYWF